MRKNVIPLAVAALACAWCVALWLTRRTFSDSNDFFYLVYNLGLAALPLPFSTALAASRSKWILVGLASAWLLLFPNAPYLLTDLIHLRPRTEVAPFWFDWLLFVSFAGAGLLIGCISLAQVHQQLRDRLRPGQAIACVSGVLALTGFGIYLGRFLRWNSWDIATQPVELIAQIAELLIRPQEHPTMLAYSFGVTVILGLSYFGPLIVFQSLQVDRNNS